MSMMLEVRLVGLDGSRSEVQSVPVLDITQPVAAKFDCVGDCYIIASEHRCVAISDEWRYRGCDRAWRLVECDTWTVSVKLDLQWARR